MDSKQQSEHFSFYSQQHQAGEYATITQAEKHPYYEMLRAFIGQYSLQSKSCLEVGCGKGALQGLVEHYCGVDISPSVACHFKAPATFVCSAVEELPFADESFDAIWSCDCLEHVLDLPKAITQLERVLKPGGYMFLRPAWHVPWWAATGVQGRDFKSLPLKLKLLKALLPIINCRYYKGPIILMKRALWLLYSKIKGTPCALSYGKLKPELNVFWASDSDACNSIDFFKLFCFFKDRSYEIYSPGSTWAAFFSPSTALIMRKPRQNEKQTSVNKRA